MNSVWRRRIISYLLPSLLFIILCAFQSTVWPGLFGSLTAPPLWLTLIIWLSVYRPQRGTVLFIYALGFLATAFTAMPLKMMLLTLLVLHLSVVFARQRVFWHGPTYFLLASFSAVTFYQIIYLSMSRILEPVPAAWMPWERLTSILLAVPAAAVIYPLMNFLDRPVVESGSELGEAS